MTENHTIPDPHLTREEAEALLVNCNKAHAGTALIKAGVEAAFVPALDKLRNSLSSPLVEDGGVEEAVEAAAKWMFEAERQCPWGGAGDPERERCRDWARSLLAAIQPFLGQGEQEAVARLEAEADRLHAKAIKLYDDKSPYADVVQGQCNSLRRAIEFLTTQQHKEEEKV